jgi:hypothetical protein
MSKIEEAIKWLKKAQWSKGKSIGDCIANYKDDAMKWIEDETSEEKDNTFSEYCCRQTLALLESEPEQYMKPIPANNG